MLKLITAILLIVISINYRGSLLSMDKTIYEVDEVEAKDNFVYLKPVFDRFEDITGLENINVDFSVESFEVASYDNESQNDKPKKDKIETYNVRSDKTVGEVAANAIENSEALVSCDDASVNCGDKEKVADVEIVEPTMSLTPIPSPIPTKKVITPTPEPIVTPIISIITIPTTICPPPPYCVPYDDEKRSPCPYYLDSEPQVYPCNVVEY
jgi:hypothetical protein